jgi:spore coat polysaccharide biosynthesis predicted glycosyltransferase SpsG
MKATQLINAMQYRQRYTIKNSKKDFIIFDKYGAYMLTSDLARHRAKYMDGGTFAALECIKNDIKL